MSTNATPFTKHIKRREMVSNKSTKWVVINEIKRDTLRKVSWNLMNAFVFRKAWQIIFMTLQ